MKETGILFRGDMVRALIDGTKTQTRRVVKGTALEWLGFRVDEHGNTWNGFTPEFVADPANALSPYGYAGDRLWVRETFHVTSGAQRWKDGTVIYRADHGADIGGIYADCAKWRPSLFMPRWASRFTLTLTSVRIERLQDISDADALAEGVEKTAGWVPLYRVAGIEANTPRSAYRGLWDSINAQRGFPWALNPWVWVLDYTKDDTTLTRKSDAS
jgi:hypothetical protein